MNSERVVWLQGDADPQQVGVKNARLAELAKEGIRVPEGFAVTAAAYQEFVRAAGLGPVIAQEIRRYRAGRDLVVVAAAIRTAFRKASLPSALTDEIIAAYEAVGGDGAEVAVRCSPIAPQDEEPEEIFLHLTSGADVLAAVRRCFAALFSAVAIGNRELRGPDHLAATMAVAVQPMVRSDLGGSGTVHGESTFVRVRAAWGLGEPPADGPDQYSVHPGGRPLMVKHRGAKPTKTVYAGIRGTQSVPTTLDEQSGLVLTDDEINELAHWSVTADTNFHRRMELDWAKDGRSGDLYVVEARPLTFPSVSLDDYARSVPLLQH
ncbi:MAG TPA: PEP/pyruvate-binding domain-containing protein [Kribbella sp.]|nr:PEP/pyruvate-binding domain-containing protein [Kribbella sp.]